MINYTMIFFHVSELLKDESILDPIRLRARPCTARISQDNAVLQSCFGPFGDSHLTFPGDT